jgi:hypothetical protein
MRKLIVRDRTWGRCLTGVRISLYYTTGKYYWYNLYTVAMDYAETFAIKINKINQCMNSQVNK